LNFLDIDDEGLLACNVITDDNIISSDEEIHSIENIPWPVPPKEALGEFKTMDEFINKFNKLDMCWEFTPDSKVELSYNGKDKFGEVDLEGFISGSF